MTEFDMSGFEMSGRAAAERLAWLGVSRRDARRLLACGFAGAPRRTTGAHLFGAEAVDRLAQWPRIKARDLRVAFPRGVLIARRDVHVSQPWEEQARCLRDGWGIGQGAAPLDVRHPIRVNGSIALVCTVAGFVATGATVTGCWLDALREHRLPNPAGPHLWVLPPMGESPL